MEGVDKFRAWKYKISLILEENDLDQYISKEITELEGDKTKDIHKNNFVKAKRVIVDSIKDHLIPHVSSLKTLKEVLDALTKLFKGKNIKQKMKLRNDSETMKSYFTRVSQIKEKIEVV